MRDRVRFKILFYRDAGGRCQACEYAREMQGHHRAKADKCFQALAEYGPEIPDDYGRHLGEGIWELRIAIGHHQHRFLYVFCREKVLVTNAFLKKSRKVPESEIETAKRRLADWRDRFHHEI